MFNRALPSVAALTTPKGAGVAAAAIVALAALGTVLSPTRDAAVAQSSAPPAVDVSKSFSTDQRKAIEQVVREYLLAHPEILVEVSKELEQRQQAQLAANQQKLIVEKKASIFRAPTDFVFGNPNGNITVVEFFDYNCGWCKRAVDELVKLTKTDPNIRVVMKELPIFGENSAFAAKAAMASIAQGKYWDFHVALMKERQVTKDNTLKIAEKVGIDVARLKRDMENPAIEAALAVNHELAQGLGIEGTPGFIVDSRVNVGFLPADGLKQMIAEIRKAGCQVC
jgi:protein-disulfide isomerase